MEQLGVTALISRLNESLDPTDDQLFQQVIFSTLKSGLISEEEMANGLLISKPTVKRWSQGKNLPSKLIRQRMYDYLLHRMESHIGSTIIVLKEVLEQNSPDYDDFKLYLLLCLDLELVSPEQVADKFGAAPATVKRWANGVAKPHPFLRSEIFKFLLEKVNQADASRCRQK